MIGPNASLSVRGAWAFMLAVSVGTLGVAAWCTWHGFWPVLPFAGLELAAVGWGLMVSMRASRYREVLSFEGDRLRIEFGLAGQGARSHIEWPRAWVRAQIERDAQRRLAPTRLVLRHAGQRVEIGRCLTDEERERLLGRLKIMLQPPRGTADAVGVAGMTLGEG